MNNLIIILIAALILLYKLIDSKFSLPIIFIVLIIVLCNTETVIEKFEPETKKLVDTISITQQPYVSGAIPAENFNLFKFKIKIEDPTNAPNVIAKYKFDNIDTFEITIKNRPVDCVVGNWYNVGLCENKCDGTGLKGQLQKRNILVQDKYNGKKCPVLTRKVDCNTQNCPINCKLSDWVTAVGIEGECDKNCGIGKKTEVKNILVKDKYGGLPCDDYRRRQVTCQKKPCPIDCVLGDWENEGSCSKICGTGTVKQIRKIKIEPKHEGKACDKDQERNINCNEQECPVDCKLGDWEDAGECNKPCGNGLKRQIRTVLVEPKHGGLACDKNINRQVKCNVKECPVDCVMSNWENDGECSKDCGGGIMKQKRSVITDPKNGGKVCETNFQRNIPCNEQECLINVLGVNNANNQPSNNTNQPSNNTNQTLNTSINNTGLEPFSSLITDPYHCNIVGGVLTCDISLLANISIPNFYVKITNLSDISKVDSLSLDVASEKVDVKKYIEEHPDENIQFIDKVEDSDVSDFNNKKTNSKKTDNEEGALYNGLGLNGPNNTDYDRIENDKLYNSDSWKNDRCYKKYGTNMNLCLKDKRCMKHPTITEDGKNICTSNEWWKEDGCYKKHGTDMKKCLSDDKCMKHPKIKQDGKNICTNNKWWLVDKCFQQHGTNMTSCISDIECIQHPTILTDDNENICVTGDRFSGDKCFKKHKTNMKTCLEDNDCMKHPKLLTKEGKNICVINPNPSLESNKNLNINNKKNKKNTYNNNLGNKNNNSGNDFNNNSSSKTLNNNDVKNLNNNDVKNSNRQNEWILDDQCFKDHGTNMLTCLKDSNCTKYAKFINDKKQDICISKLNVNDLVASMYNDKCDEEGICSKGEFNPETLKYLSSKITNNTQNVDSEDDVMGMLSALNINELNNYLEKLNMNGDSVSEEVSGITNFINDIINLKNNNSDRQMQNHSNTIKIKINLDYKLTDFKILKRVVRNALKGGVLILKDTYNVGPTIDFIPGSVIIVIGRLSKRDHDDIKINLRIIKEYILGQYRNLLCPGPCKNNNCQIKEIPINENGLKFNHPLAECVSNIPTKVNNKNNSDNKYDKFTKKPEQASISQHHIKGVSNIFSPRIVIKSKKPPKKSTETKNSVKYETPKLANIEPKAKPENISKDNKTRDMVKKHTDDYWIRHPRFCGNKIKCQQKELDKRISNYLMEKKYNPGFSFAPPSSWEYEKRQKSCMPQKKCLDQPVPIFDKGIPHNALEYSGVGTILPKFRFSETYDANLYENHLHNLDASAKTSGEWEKYLNNQS